MDLKRDELLGRLYSKRGQSLQKPLKDLSFQVIFSKRSNEKQHERDAQPPFCAMNISSKVVNAFNIQLTSPSLLHLGGEEGRMRPPTSLRYLYILRSSASTDY